MEAYYTGTFLSEEFWASSWDGDAPTVLPGPPTSYNLVRNYPYAEEVVIKNDSTGAVIDSSDQIVAGTPVRVEVNVRNKVSEGLNVKVRLLLDQSRGSPYNSDETSSAQLVPSNTTKTFTLTYTPNASGIWYYAFEVKTTLQNGTTTRTDSWDWAQALEVQSRLAEIVAFSPPTGILQRGDQVTATVRVKNTGITTRSFWVGLSFAHSTATGDGWPEGWYDIQPVQTGILEPEEEEEVTFPVAIAETFRPGQYYAVSCVWDAFNEELYIMEGRIDSTLYHRTEHPEWVDNPDLGMISFSLPQFNVPHAARTIMDEFETISRILENKGIQELYLEGKKPLFCLRVSVPINIAGIPVNVGGALLIDLADLCELTPEGKEWTTLWIDSEVGGVAFGVNLDEPGDEVEFKLVDAAIIMHNFDYNERGIADFRDHVLEWFTGTTPEIGFGSITVPGMCFTGAKYYDRDNIEGPSYDRCGTTKLGITVMNAINVLHKVEMRTQYVQMALLAWSLGQDPQENIVPIAEYVSHVNAILDSYPNCPDVFRDFTYDDGDWPLEQGQPQTNLKMRMVDSSEPDSAHRFFIDVPEGSSNLTFSSSGGTGDLAILFKYGMRPNLHDEFDYDSCPYNQDSTLGFCTIPSPDAGRYYIALPAVGDLDEYEGVRFVATYECESPPQISVTPASQDFGFLELGSYQDKAFTVENTGAETLEGSASVSPPFSIESGDSYSLTHGQTHTVTVRFSPTTTGAFD